MDVPRLSTFKSSTYAVDILFQHVHSADLYIIKYFEFISSDNFKPFKQQLACSDRFYSDIRGMERSHISLGGLTVVNEYHYVTPLALSSEHLTHKLF